MPRPKGTKNKSVLRESPTLSLTTEERIDFLANLIVDKILAEKKRPTLKEVS